MPGDSANFMAELQRHTSDGMVWDASERRGQELTIDTGRRRRGGEGEPEAPAELNRFRLVVWLIGGIFGLASGIGGLVAAEPYVNPFLTKAQFRDAQAAINHQLEEHTSQIQGLKGDLTELKTDAKESKELQLMDALQRIQDRIERLPAGSELVGDYRTQRNEIEQRLAKVRRELGR